MQETEQKVQFFKTVRIFGHQWICCSQVTLFSIKVCFTPAFLFLLSSYSNSLNASRLFWCAIKVTVKSVAVLQWLQTKSGLYGINSPSRYIYRLILSRSWLYGVHTNKFACMHDFWFCCKCILLSLGLRTETSISSQRRLSQLRFFKSSNLFCFFFTSVCSVLLDRF